LTMPAVAALSRERHVAFIAPPHLPYPPALAQRGIDLERALFIDRATFAESPVELLWAAEQMLRCPAFGAVLVWPPTVNDKELRRLQLAAEAGKNLALVYRPFIAAASSSPAALRLCLSPAKSALQIEIKKCRGGRAGKIVRVGTDDIPQRAA
jgi:protein ImuA